MSRATTLQETPGEMMLKKFQAEFLPKPVEDVLSTMGTPFPRQVEFLELVRQGKHRRIFYGGARGGGKSWAVRRALVERRVKYPRSTGLLLRRTYPDLELNHILKLLQELPPGLATYNQQKHRFQFENGSILQLGYCKTDADVLQYQGQEYDDIGIDEITQWQELWFTWLTASNRTTRSDLRPIMVASGNPGGIGHAWVRRRWIDRDFGPTEQPDDYVFVPAKVYDNPALVENDPDYVKTLEALPKDLRRAWLDGDWDIFAGQYFGELRREVHGFTGNPPRGWNFRMFDYGYSAPSACYWGRVDEEGEVWLYRELYGPGMTYSALANRIIEMSVDPYGKPEDIRYTVGPPDLWQRTGDTGITGAEVMTTPPYNIPLTKADDNRIEGWRVMREHLRYPIRLHVHLENCPNWWRTVPALIYDEHRPEDVDGDGEDHAGDATRYGLNSRPAPYQPDREREREQQREPERSPSRAGTYY